MLDVYKITSVLEKLPDAALQQYAAMHKQDPYVLSLAVEESNRRKRIRSAPQGQQQAQQPPVNEQAVASMAPEDTGIAQLPAGPMEFADGGIVAFADGGFSGSIEDLLRREQEEMAAGVRPALPPERRPDERVNLGSSERTSTSTAVRAPTGGIADINKFYEEARKRYDGPDPTAEARESDRREDLTEQQRLRDEYLANKPQGEAYTRREAALKKEEGEEPAKKEKNLKMALINAGLGMMAGTSPNAFVNIGAGAMQGVKAYQEGIKDIEKAAERRQELYDKIEEFRRNEKSVDAKERLAMGQKVAEINRDYRAKAIEARMKVYGISHSTAAAITGFMLDREKLMIQERGASARTMATVNSQAQTLEKTALMEIGKTLREKYTAINKRMMEGTRALTPQAQAADAAELAEVTRDMQRIDAQLRIIAKLPAPEAPAVPAPAGDRPPLGSFQK